MAVIGIIAFIWPFWVATAVADVEPASNQDVSQKGPALLNDLHSPVIGHLQGDVVVIEFFDYA